MEGKEGDRRDLDCGDVLCNGRISPDASLVHLKDERVRVRSDKDDRPQR
jgi:hypothetical protein